MWQLYLKDVLLKKRKKELNMQNQNTELYIYLRKCFILEFQCLCLVITCFSQFFFIRLLSL